MSHTWDGNFNDLVIYIGNQQPMTENVDGSITIHQNKKDPVTYELGDSIGDNIVSRSQMGIVPDGSKHYIKFKITKDGTFRKDFFNSTDEYIVQPYVSPDGLNYIWGTDRLSTFKIAALRLKYPLSLWVGDTPPK